MLLEGTLLMMKSEIVKHDVKSISTREANPQSVGFHTSVLDTRTTNLAGSESVQPPRSSEQR